MMQSHQRKNTKDLHVALRIRRKFMDAEIENTEELTRDSSLFFAAGWETLAPDLKSLSRLLLQRSEENGYVSRASTDEQRMFPEPLKASLPLKRANSSNSLFKFLEDAFKDFTGMQDVKTALFQQGSFLEIQKQRAAKGIKTVDTVSRHLIFTGPPGTGKTTVARVVAQLYHRLGILPTTNVIEASRNTLVAGFTGQTALKTQAAIQSALGGVLFIDEAYTLAQSEKDHFGQEAIDTLLKGMEDHRQNLVVIVAGYQQPMNAFLESNAGLRSRFNRTIGFTNYTAKDLCDIFYKLMMSNQYHCEHWCALQEEMHAYFQAILDKCDETFSNGRFVRNLFESAVEAQANRLMMAPEPSSERALQVLEEDDIRQHFC